MSPRRFKSLSLAAVVVAGATLLALWLRPHVAPVNLTMVYLLGVVAVSARSDRAISTFTALASVAAFDFFCVPPYLTFAVTDPQYLITFAAMMIVALVISTQTDRIRAHAGEAVAREKRAQILYRLSDRLSSEHRVFETARVAAALASEALSAQVVILLPENEVVSFRRRTSDHFAVPDSEELLANWVLRHGRKAGRGVDDLLAATALYVPLRGTSGVLAVMAVMPAEEERIDTRERDTLIDLFANQTALAIERTQSQNAAEAARIQIQTERMRSSLLSAVSHDLLTPLASITGAASTVREQGERITPEIREELLSSISEEADRLTRLIGNLLDMTRFETGGVKLRRDAYPLEEIVGTALHRVQALLKGREISVRLPADLPLINGDEVLLGQVFVNLLENASKYTPSSTGIEITAREVADMIEVEFRDYGPGLEPEALDHLFEKFYRSHSRSVHGSGLGLAISKAVVEAHGGRIAGFNHPQGGAVFRFSLPAHPLGVEERV